MDREYLENYEAEEAEEYERLVTKKIEAGKFDFSKNRYPPKARFKNLQRPVTDCTLMGCGAEDRWIQVPFTGSTIIYLPAFPVSVFERSLFKKSEIPKVIDFIKETGRLQIALPRPSRSYAGLDYLDPFFLELKPPRIWGLPLFFLGTKKEIVRARDTFITLAKVSFFEFLGKVLDGFEPPNLYSIGREIFSFADIYVYLKLRRYLIAEEIENALIDNPMKALCLLTTCANFITDPFTNLRFDTLTFSLKEIKLSNVLLPKVFQPSEVSFPHEIGKFLLEKLTYAPKGMRACNELIDHYDSYDLQKVQESLNEAITGNHPDIVNKSVEEFSEILDNVWNDRTIPQRIRNLRIGIPISIAALGSVAAGPIGGVGGLLAGLGFQVVSKTIDIGMEELPEKAAKLGTRSHQANIYDFKKKYKGKINR